jgi:hypothetical protein
MRANFITAGDYDVLHIFPETDDEVYRLSEWWNKNRIEQNSEVSYLSISNLVFHLPQIEPSKRTLNPFEDIREWMDAGLPRLWEVCIDLQTGGKWICVSFEDGLIKLTGQNPDQREILIPPKEFVKYFKFKN